MGKKSIHVVPTGDRWGTIRDGGSRHSNLADTQREVIAAARDQARRDGVELFIHGEKGQIRDRNSYGNDPYPPRG
ncbi:MAG: DUF2188 domain-containing protein [Propionicimonas sp.]|uniref:DUF2188 domain-containing protein n=1 Tax=Propionicimonas sp. TaxID=1955623 RepID=UPI001DCC2982|nr:DUF2188 domain-containing protein [Propionicimonas sp.]MBU4188255.1 DUF2188 domain-containing protein [Actinomycetota bacterium]MBU4207471.1 DUF2188 domain-containing protein [Actinomycetota bacterium]MBU4251316.1 DUF2188 domain-containing protein [Actinomycetota bacterium]MBU4364335.1 DUF2188 domain-containing protein [Actinomycetota bacterium]MBU4410916.1 DUF2188 domain-containing protein [Actinomycetota bacterium]